MVNVYTLLGKKSLDISIQCLRSLLNRSATKLRLNILEDGTLSEENIQEIKVKLDDPIILRKNQREDFICEKLRSYPNCLSLRKNLVLSHKLFDLYFLSPDNTLHYVDSDILFLKPFAGLFENTDNKNIFTEDIFNSYKIPFKFFFDKDKLLLPRKLNTGLFAFNRHQLDLDFLEYFLAKTYIRASNFETHWHAEQTCWGLLAMRSKSELIDDKQLSVFDKRVNNNYWNCIALHFVSTSRGCIHEYLNDDRINNDYPVEQISTAPIKSLKMHELLYERAKRKLFK